MCGEIKADEPRRLKQKIPKENEKYLRSSPHISQLHSENQFVTRDNLQSIPQIVYTAKLKVNYIVYKFSIV